MEREPVNAQTHQGQGSMTGGRTPGGRARAGGREHDSERDIDTEKQREREIRIYRKRKSTRRESN